uniref:Uncharacterized protein n=1 Tax=Setaria italica TaxID=4555 RepID=K3Z167_SETIT
MLGMEAILQGWMIGKVKRLMSYMIKGMSNGMGSTQMVGNARYMML